MAYKMKQDLIASEKITDKLNCSDHSLLYFYMQLYLLYVLQTKKKAALTEKH